MSQNLTENRLERKRYAVKGGLGHFRGMAASRRKKPKTALQELFLRRVQEEMERLGISRNELAGRAGGPKQSTFNEIMNGSDPRLEQVHKIAVALGVSAWELLAYPKVVEKRQAGSVTKFPEQPVLGQRDKHSQEKKKGRA